jgi:hypothetical protein
LVDEPATPASVLGGALGPGNAPLWFNPKTPVLFPSPKIPSASPTANTPLASVELANILVAADWNDAANPFFAVKSAPSPDPSDRKLAPAPDPFASA